MIKPESNAPSQMQQWVRTTDKQIEDLERSIARLQSFLAGSLGTDHEQNFALNNVFSFNRFDDGTVATTSSGMRFIGDIVADTGVDVAGVLTVGNPTRQLFDDQGEPIGLIPNFEMTAGEYQINPVTGDGDYLPGVLHMTDSAVDLSVNGVIAGDGLSINLSNTNQVARTPIAVITVTGDGTNAVYEIDNNDATVASYVPGKYVTVTGVDPAGFNVSNVIILSVDSSGTNLLFTVECAESGAWVEGGYSVISGPDGSYDGKLSVQGVGPDFTGVTVNQNGVFVGNDAGNPSTASVSMTPGVVSAPEVAASYLNVDGTRVFVTSVEPSAPSDGDLWIDPAGSPLGGVAAPHATTHGVSGSDPVTLAQSQIVNLTTDLAGKAATVHTHAIADVTSLQTTLDAKVDESYQQVTTGWLTAATGWGSVSGTYTEKNGIVQVNVTATRTGADISAGNITNNTVCTISTGYRPLVETLAGGGPAGPVLGAYISASAGNVVITAIGTGISTGATIDINATYIKA